MPCQWMLVCSGRRLTSRTRKVSPSLTRSVGGGKASPYPHPAVIAAPLPVRRNDRGAATICCSVGAAAPPSGSPASPPATARPAPSITLRRAGRIVDTVTGARGSARLLGRDGRRIVEAVGALELDLQAERADH